MTPRGTESWLDRMSTARKMVIANCGVRVAYGAVMLAVPGRVGARGRAATPPVIGDVLLRGIGGREVALHAAGAANLLRGARCGLGCRPASVVT